MDTGRETFGEVSVSPEAKEYIAKRVIFDVVSSVKGGSGKSTYSLLLALHYNSTPGSIAYILDLDLRGTSWEKNYGHYIKTPFFDSDDKNSLEDYYKASFEDLSVLTPQQEGLRKDITSKRIRYRNYPFINSLMWDFKAFRSKSFWSEIDFGIDSRIGTVRLCLSKTDNGNDVDQIEVDIFEHTIFQIILHILDHHRSQKNIGEIHIILDMPPSYEKHAEAILKHLLVSEDSKLFQLAKDRKNQFYDKSTDATAYYLPYEIRLFMLCTINPAHLEQNGVYFFHWLKERKYSDALKDLIKDTTVQIKDASYLKTGVVRKGNTNRFKACFILNDIPGVVGNFIEGKPTKPDYRQLAEWAKQISDARETERFSHYRQAREEMNFLDPEKGRDLIDLRAFPHLPLPATYGYFDSSLSIPRSLLKITEDMLRSVEQLLDGIQTPGTVDCGFLE